jgi:hypothetical protein
MIDRDHRPSESAEHLTFRDDNYTDKNLRRDKKIHLRISGERGKQNG